MDKDAVAFQGDGCGRNPRVLLPNVGGPRRAHSTAVWSVRVSQLANIFGKLYCRESVIRKY